MSGVNPRLAILQLRKVRIVADDEGSIARQCELKDAVVMNLPALRDGVSGQT